MKEFMSNLDESDAIVSLNYDLLVDRALSLCNPKSKPVFVNYGIPFRYGIPLNDPICDYDTNSEIKVYKLHGSLNWLYCPRCQCLDATTERDGTSNYVNEYRKKEQKNKVIYCQKCRVRYESLIIAPTFLKNYNNTYMNQLWRDTEEILSKADEIVFIGYSMPDADIVLRCMFKRAYYASSLYRGGRYCRIRVIDCVEKEDNQDNKKDDDGKSACQEVTMVNHTRERYFRLFKEIDYRDTGFFAYIESLRSQHPPV